MIVPDVDEALAAYAAAGYEVAERWGPPFAILSPPDGPRPLARRPGHLGGPQHRGPPPQDAASAQRAPGARGRRRAATVAALAAAGWEPAGDALSGPGGSQQLVRRGPVFLEVFAGG